MCKKKMNKVDQGKLVEFCEGLKKNSTGPKNTKELEDILGTKNAIKNAKSRGVISSDALEKVERYFGTSFEAPEQLDIDLSNMGTQTSIDDHAILIRVMHVQMRMESMLEKLCEELG